MLGVAGELAVVANTGDDVEIHGAHVSPDPDLVAFWLADLIDDRGWGLRDDTFAVMDALRALGDDVWFNLGDRDLAWCLRRARRLAEGATPTAAMAEACDALGLRARVLPMSDEPVRTWVLARGAWHPFQEFMIRERAVGPIDGLQLRGVEAARPSADVLAAIEDADAIVVGPSNPVISIGPILQLPGLRDALKAARAPVVAVSPLVGGEVVKGPTEAFLDWAGAEMSAEGIARYYGDVLDGIVGDERSAELPLVALVTDTLMADAASRERLARDTLDFALALGR
jgi:LPPG:FO 2-phospho-L-lactate transferase